MFVVEHMTITSYHPCSNVRAKHFVDTLKRALKKSNSGCTDEALQQFLQVYQLTPNIQVGIMFVWKIRSDFDKLILKKEKDEHMVQKTGNKFYEVCEKVFY